MVLVYTGLLLVYIFLYIYRNSKKKKCITICIYLFLISALKSIYTGDLNQYILHYHEIQSYGVTSIFRGFGFSGIRDVTFYGIARLFSLAGFTVEGWLIFISLFFAFSISYYIYNYSDNEWLSLLLVMSLYFRFSITGIRQTIAICIILFSFRYIQKRNPIKFVLIVVLAFLFHSSALLFLPAYFISEMKYGRKQIIILIVSIVMILVNPNFFRNIIANIAWNEELGGYANSTTSLSWSGFIIFFSIWIVCYCFRSMTNINRIDYDRKINLVLIGIILQGASTIIAESFRLGYYYNIFCISLLPDIIQNNNNTRNRVLLSRSVSIVLLCYMLINNLYTNYQFFWQ